MSSHGIEIWTCSRSLLHPGDCCASEIDGRPCRHPATLAVLTGDLTEHTRCAIHAADAIATKPLVMNPIWEDS